MRNQNIIRISVLDFANKPIYDAAVKLTVKQSSMLLKYDEYEGAYTTTDFKPDRYDVTVSANGMETQRRSLLVGQSGAEEVCILGIEGLPFYYRGTVKVPFEPNREFLGITMQVQEEGKEQEMLKLLAEKYKIFTVQSPENYQKNGLFIFSFPFGTSEKKMESILGNIRKLNDILAAGPLLKQDEKNASILTDEIIVRFRGSIEEKQVRSIAKKLGLTILRTIPFAGNAWHFRVNKAGLYLPLYICDQLVQLDLVEYAEPNLFHTFEDDAISPNNYLFPEQWDHPLINTPDAWQEVNDHLGVAQRFGNPDVYLAVVDSGVNTDHPQFNRNVSNGQPKVVAAFNFNNMVANNNSLGGSHGTNCASASVGYTDVSSVAGGVPDGTVGIAGNCRLIAVRRGGTEADYADMYVWIGGFNPNSTRMGFPAILARGADIITSSFGAGFTAPIAGVMRDAFDFLTTYGRNGKGVILTFSVGNYASNINFHLERPWAAYPKTFACGASSLANDGTTEVISAYSGSGTMLDFCAPSHDAYVGGSPQHNPSQNYGAWTATVLNGVSDDDGIVPRNRERQTTLSAAAAGGATSITVASTAGMAIGQAIMIGNPTVNISASEAKRISNIVGNTISFTPALFANKANGTVVIYGNRDYNSSFGGTSYATPVIAGITALMLSVNNRLTWMEVREILRETADEIDPNNNNAIGRWRDESNRISTDPGYTGPFFSQYYGYGRVNAATAVNAARLYPSDRDIYVRDNMADTGANTSSSPHWRGVDIWVRNSNDGVVPVNYATDANTVHQPPIAGQDNWLNVRYRNRGSVASYPFYLRAYLVHFPGAEFIYPNDFIPTVRPNGTIPNPLTPGTYLIGEQLVNAVAAGTDGIVTLEWQSHLIPPQTVVVRGIAVTWHPCLLVEVSPQDGFTPTGNHVWDNNNLAQKNISIIYPDAGGDNAMMTVLGNTFRRKIKTLKIDIFTKPRNIKTPYFIFFPDNKMNEILLSIGQEIPGAKVGSYKKAKVLWIVEEKKVSFEIPYTGLTSMVVGIGKQRMFEEDFELNIIQYSDKKISGSCGIEFRTKS
ncbi:MAG: S8 family serine peptidase [Saprospiraceae bacterium]|nr:S8 family serine peptidase [Saprospiraceae bacterium]